MKISNITKIGSIDYGIEGSDEYLRVDVEDSDPPDDRDPDYDRVDRELTAMYWRDSSHPGGYFCHGVTVQTNPYDHTTFTVIVHHQYDV